MFITKERADEIIDDFKRGIISDYKDRLSFIAGLITDNDWTFVIKSHSLIESLMNELVDGYIQKPELKEIIERLPLHGDYGSKVSLAKKLDAITTSEVKFILCLSELRNKLVHKFEYIDFSFETHIGQMNRDQIKSLNVTLKINVNQSEWYTIRKSDDSIKIKLAYWNALHNLIANLIDRIHLKTASDRNEKEAITTSMSIIEDLFKKV